MKIAIANYAMGNLASVRRAFEDIGAEVIHVSEQTPAGAKSAMQEAGIPVRRNFVSSAAK